MKRILLVIFTLIVTVISVKAEYRIPDSPATLNKLCKVSNNCKMDNSLDEFGNMIERYTFDRGARHFNISVYILPDKVELTIGVTNNKPVYDDDVCVSDNQLAFSTVILYGEVSIIDKTAPAATEAIVLTFAPDTKITSVLKSIQNILFSKKYFTTCIPSIKNSKKHIEQKETMIRCEKIEKDYRDTDILLVSYLQSVFRIFKREECSQEIINKFRDEICDKISKKYHNNLEEMIVKEKGYVTRLYNNLSDNLKELRCNQEIIDKFHYGVCEKTNRIYPEIIQDYIKNNWAKGIIKNKQNDLDDDLKTLKCNIKKVPISTSASINIENAEESVKKESFKPYGQVMKDMQVSQPTYHVSAQTILKTDLDSIDIFFFNNKKAAWVFASMYSETVKCSYVEGKDYDKTPAFWTPRNKEKYKAGYQNYLKFERLMIDSMGECRDRI